MSQSLGFAFCSAQVRCNSPRNTVNKLKRRRDSEESHYTPTKTLRTSSPSVQNTPDILYQMPMGRPLPLARHIDTLSHENLRTILKELCARHSKVADDLQQTFTPPTVSQALDVLAQFERKITTAFPYGGDNMGDYAYNRVSPSIAQFLDAMLDYTLHFLPPNESYAANTLAFLAGATSLVSRLPDWHKEAHNRIKREAFEQINAAWELVLRGIAGTDSVIIRPYKDALKQLNHSSCGLLDGAVREVNALYAI